MKFYKSPELKLLAIASSDIIATSPATPENTTLTAAGILAEGDMDFITW